MYDDEFTYRVSERNGEGRYVTRTITIRGPVGLMTTSTRKLDDQLGSRVLEVFLPDEPTHTREIMVQRASRLMGVAPDRIDAEPFIAAHEWLDAHGCRNVEIPFAAALAHIMPCSITRMRRDWEQLLNTIAAIAFLHQMQRERTTGSDAVIATMTDYTIARQLLTPVFDVIINSGVTPQVREAVEAIRAGEDAVTLGELAERIGIHKPAASNRLQQAVAGGWLINDQTHQGRPARIRRGTPLPTEHAALPTVRELQRYGVRDGWGTLPLDGGDDEQELPAPEWYTQRV